MTYPTDNARPDVDEMLVRAVNTLLPGLRVANYRERWANGSPAIQALSILSEMVGEGPVAAGDEVDPETLSQHSRRPAGDPAPEPARPAENLGSAHPSPHPQGGTETLRALAEAATPGSWAVPVANVFRVIAPEATHTNGPAGAAPPYPWCIVANVGDETTGPADAAFIAASVNYVRAMLAAAPAPTEAGDQ